MKYPSVSVIVATFNSEKTIGKCLESVRDQTYPQDKVNILLADGDSKDTTLSIVKKFNVRIISIPSKLQNAEYNKGIAVREAKGDVLLMIDHDNVLPHPKWLMKMVQPLIDDASIVGVETLRYHYDSSASILDRYFALFGAGDPLAFYLGKTDRLSFLYNAYNLHGRVRDRGNYYVVKFDPQYIPTLGANGFLIRRELLFQHAQIDIDHFFHIDVNVDLIKKGFNTYAFVKDDIIHLTGYRNIINFLSRRKLFMEQFHINIHTSRRYSVYEPKDTLMLIVFILYATTFVKPFIDSFRGYLKIPDLAWFLHPFLCFALVTIYGYVIIKTNVKKYARQLFY